MGTPGTGVFLNHLRESGLLDDPQLAEIAQSGAAVAGDDRALAQELVTKEVLTRFQAEQVLAGRTGGFLIGPYVITDKIGAGGMGQVYKATHQRMKRTVALKVLPKSRRADPQAQARFMREVEASAQLNHPNIVTAYDVGEDRDITYLALEYVEGTDLYHLIKQKGRLEAGEAANIVYQAALGLEHAREHGIVHRDIKPHNILLDTKGTAKVLDMGLARIQPRTEEGEESGSLTRTGTVMGTVDYLAPEQAEDTHTVDTRADIYGLGCTLYHMLTGKVPFPGGNVMSKLKAHAMKTPADVRTLAPDTPDELVEVVTKMMAKKADDRYQTPAEVAEALLPWVSASVGGMGSGLVRSPGPSGVRPGVSTGPPSVSQTTPPASSGYKVEEFAALGADQDAAAPTRAPALPAHVPALPPRAQASPLSRIPVWAWAAGAAVVVLIAAILFWPRGGGGPVEQPKAPDKTTAKTPESGTGAGTKTGRPQAPDSRLQPEPGFPVVRLGRAGRGPYKTLADAFAEIYEGEDVVLELRTNRVLRTTPVTAKCRSLVLHGARGYQPVIFTAERRAAPNEFLVKVEGTGAIVIDGVHFITTHKEGPHHLSVVAPDVRVSRCSFRHPRDSFQVSIMAHHAKARRVMVRDCFFCNSNVAMRSFATASGRVDVSNCVAAGMVRHFYTLETQCPPGASPARLDVALHGNTVIGWWVSSESLIQFCRTLSKGDDRSVIPERVAVDLQRNAFLPYLRFVVPRPVRVRGPIDADMPDVEKWKAALRWTGRGNIIGPCKAAAVAVGAARGAPHREEVLARDVPEFLKSWAPNLELKCFAHAVAPYKWDEVPPNAWSLAHFQRVRESLPVELRAAGADLSRIPDPPQVDAAGLLIRPAKPPTNPRAAETSEAAAPAKLRGLGGDLSRIPTPPDVDAQGNVIRPGKPATNPRAAGE